MKKFLFPFLLCLCFGASPLCAQNANTAISAEYQKAVSTFCKNFHITDIITQGMLEAIREKGLSLTAAQEEAMASEMEEITLPYVEKDLIPAFHSKFTLQEPNEVNRFLASSVGQQLVNATLKSGSGQTNAMDEMIQGLSSEQQAALLTFYDSAGGTKFYTSLEDVFKSLEHLQQNTDLITELSEVVLKYLQ